MNLSQIVDPEILWNCSIYEVKGCPVAWASHCGYGRKSFNPRFREKEAAQWQLKLQHQPYDLIDMPIIVDFLFGMPIPSSFSKSKRRRIEEGEIIYHEKRPDRTNLIKFIEDCLTGTIIKDDNIICDGRSCKIYSMTPKTVILIRERKRWEAEARVSSKKKKVK